MATMSYQECMELRKSLGFSIIPEEQFEHSQYMMRKFDEYKAHFGKLFCSWDLQMSDEEIAKYIDLCIKYNREWEGFIVPKIDYSKNDI